MPALCPDWTRDWSGCTALIAASGPSQRREDLDHARGKCRVLVINETWRLAPWADVLYFCDATWWNRRGPRDFPGRMVVGRPQGGMLSAALPANVESTDRMIWDGERIGAGENSGFQAINLVAVWGVRRIILTGYDMQPRAACNPGVEMHWHGPHEGRPNPKAERFAHWRDLLARAAADLSARGVEVLNASRETALDAFPRVRLTEVL